MKKYIGSIVFIVALIAAWGVSDYCLTQSAPLGNSPYFLKNDYDLTRMENPQKVWDKAFFGSSVVVTAYMPEISQSGYVNLGISYGKVTDIYEMLKKDIVNIKSDLVIGLNDISFLDSLPTNETYPWHKKWYQHYLYFNRDTIFPIVDGGFDNLLDGKPFLGEPLHANQTKNFTYGAMSEEELLENYESMLERFADCTVEKDCKEGFEALEKLIELCKERNIRLRAIWMPCNPKIPLYDFVYEVMDYGNEIFKENDIEVFDMTSMIEAKYFYDSGHISHGEGSEYFTKVADEFLRK